ncbi:hypothetical protein EV356DRAFT_496566 [Viridothelium virens]|uniref:Uncharacterized protein n=1 Tax=Viridothelium virens TaxID=1048519 RepID=A0A6A6GTZ4_VIRVR|nr:hypothetical protein EV356DRAFT_496566 [Viridothelium virens]
MQLSFLCPRLLKSSSTTKADCQGRVSVGSRLNNIYRLQTPKFLYLPKVTKIVDNKSELPKPDSRWKRFNTAQIANAKSVLTVDDLEY